MDWSSVFEDEGEEDGNWTRSHEPSSRTHMIEFFSLNGQYTPFICYAFTVNYILGVGCLGVPFAFLQSGLVLGIILIMVLSYISYITVVWIAIATQQEISLSIYRVTSNPFIMSPYTALAKRKKLKNEPQPVVKSTNVSERSGLLHSQKNSQSFFGSIYSSISLQAEENTANKILQQFETSSGSSNKRKNFERLRSQTSDDDLAMDIRELEVTDLTEEFLGHNWKMFYQFSLMTLTYVGLLAYTQVFNDTFITQLWPDLPIFIPPLIFGAFVVPLSCMDISEQITVQVAMAAIRFLALGILLFGTLIALIVDWEHSALANNRIVVFSQFPTSEFSIFSSSYSFEGIPLVNWSAFGMIFTTAIFSQLFQHSVPGLIRPLSNENKKYVPVIFRYALLTTASIYIVTGTLCVLYFGQDIKQAINLNFIDFDWGINAKNNMIASWILRLLSMIVVLFPVLDTLSVFPLIAITLGNNLNSSFPQLYTLVKGFCDSQERDDTSPTPTKSTPSPNHGHEAQKITTILWRLIAAVPPVLCSILVKNLIFSLQLAGLCGIIVALIIPSLLFQQIQYRIALIPFAMKTVLPFPKDVYFHDNSYIYVVFMVGMIAIVITVAQMFL